MAEIEELLRDHVLANAGVAALIGTRWYPQHLPQQPTLPAVRYWRVDSPEVITKPNVSTLRIIRARFQIDVYAVSYTALLAVRVALLPVLWAFTWGASNSVIGTRVADMRDGFEETSGRWRMGIDVMVTYNE